MTYCIYLIKNNISESIYVGHTNNINRRFKEHKSEKFRNNILKRMHFNLYYAIKKYGIENFEFNIIEKFNDLNESLEAEEFWISYYKSISAKLYNIAKGGQASNQGVVRSAESRLKMSIAKKGIKLSEEHKKAIGQAGLGRIVSEATKLKQSRSNVGKKHKKFSIEAKQKMSKIQAIRQKKIDGQPGKNVTVINKITQEILNFDSVSKCSRFFKIPRTNLLRFIKNIKCHNLYIFKFQDDNAC